VASVPLVTALLLLVALLASAAELSRLSAPVVLVLAGLAIGFVPGVPEVRVEPQARRRGRAMELGGPETRLQSYGFFEVVVFLVEYLSGLLDPRTEGPLPRVARRARSRPRLRRAGRRLAPGHHRRSQPRRVRRRPQRPVPRRPAGPGATAGQRAPP
jgi:hypothetical protein